MPNDVPPGGGVSYPSPATRNLIDERLRSMKRSAIDAAMGRAESWATKIINGEAGVLVSDLPQLLAALNLKVVDAGLVVVDPAIASAYEAIVAKATSGRSLLLGEAE